MPNSINHPKKLLYKGSTYTLARTEADQLWGAAAPLLERLLAIATDDELPAAIKREQGASLIQSLREYLKLLGL